jgi:dihydroorotase
MVLVDPHANRLVQRTDVLSKCGWSPFEGEVFTHAVRSTWINGELAYDGKQVSSAVRGRRLQFLR